MSSGLCHISRNVNKRKKNLKLQIWSFNLRRFNRGIRVPKTHKSPTCTIVLLLLKTEKTFQEEIEQQLPVANFPHALRSQQSFNTPEHSPFLSWSSVQVREYLAIMHRPLYSSFSSGKCEHMNLNLEHANTQKANEFFKYPQRSHIV